MTLFAKRAANAGLPIYVYDQVKEIEEQRDTIEMYAHSALAKLS